MIRKLFFLSLLASFMVSCQKDSVPPTYTISDIEKQYCFFQNGSQWIYQNDSTLIKDTVTVSGTYRSMDAIMDNGKIDHYTEIMEVYFFSTYRGANSNLNNSTSNKISYYDHINPGECLRYNESVDMDNISIPFWPVPKTNSNYGNYSYSIQPMNAMWQNGFYYSNLYKVHIDNKQPSNEMSYLAVEYIISRNIGVIKKVFYRGTKGNSCASCVPVESWSLIGSEITQ